MMSHGDNQQKRVALSCISLVLAQLHNTGGVKHFDYNTTLYVYMCALRKA